jgi:arylsulfatase A-like enzyme
MPDMKRYRNVLFIAVDDLRPELGCFGKTKLHTPHLDRLAARSRRFERAYCQVPVCMPSRASLMSGVRPDERTLHRTKDILTRGEPTLPGLLKAEGYQTVSIGKVYHYNDEDPASWTRRHTDTFYEQEYACHGYCSGYQLPENQRRIRNYGKQFHGVPREELEMPAITECAEAPDEAYPDGIIAQRACEELAGLAQREDPFFLAVGFYRPHLPWAAPKRYWDLYDRSDVDLAENPFLPKGAVGCSALVDFIHYGDETIRETYTDFGHYNEETFPVLDEEKQRECVHGYWACVSFTDAQVGKVLETLEQQGLAEETVVVFWGDNGFHLGEHRLWAKGTSFEESTRVPLLFDAPGVTDGTPTTELVELLDIYPTLCELLGLDAPAHLDGMSLAPMLADASAPGKDAIFSRIYDQETVRTQRYRLTHYRKPTPDGDMGHLPTANDLELFDLEVDPQENVNVAQRPEYAGVVKELLETLK